MGRKAKIPSAKLIWNGFLHVTVRTLNSYEQTTNSGISRKAGPLFYANNEPKSALARDLGDCRDNKGKLAKRVFTCCAAPVRSPAVFDLVVHKGGFHAILMQACGRSLPSAS